MTNTDPSASGRKELEPETSNRLLWWALGGTGALLLLLVLVGLVATVVVPNLYSKSRREAHAAAARMQIRALEEMLERERARLGVYPSSLEELRREGAPLAGQALPVDPWNHPFEYVPPRAAGEKPIVVSLGADGKPGGAGEAADVSGP